MANETKMNHCQTCPHWKKLPSGWGLCNHPEADNYVNGRCEIEGIVTRENYGCVLHPDNQSKATN